MTSPDTTNSNGQKPASAGMQGSAGMTLMRGTPEEIGRDLAAIDRRIQELKQREESAHAAFVYEKNANARLEREITRLREALVEVEHIWKTESEACADNSAAGVKMAKAAHDALWPNTCSAT